jgi:hypothetical protein
MDYFSRKSLSKYLMNNIEFNKHDVDIFINGTWQKYAGNSSKLQGYLNFAFDQRENKNGTTRKGAQSDTVLREMLIEATFNQTNF